MNCPSSTVIISIIFEGFPFFALFFNVYERLIYCCCDESLLWCIKVVFAFTCLGLASAPTSGRFHFVYYFFPQDGLFSLPNGKFFLNTEDRDNQKTITST